MSDTTVVEGAAATIQSATAPVVDAGTTTKPVGTSPVSTTKPTSIIADAGKDTTKDAATTDTNKSILADANVDGTDPKLGPDGKPLVADVIKAEVPEKYEITAPEGMTLDMVALEKFTPIARELGLSNEQVQKLANFQAEQTKANTQLQKDNFNKFLEDTKTETKTHFGAKLQEELKFVAKARDMFADKETMELLEHTGLANHKAIITLFGKLGRMISEHKQVDGKSTTGETRTDGQIIYGKIPA